MAGLTSFRRMTPARSIVRVQWRHTYCELHAAQLSSFIDQLDLPAAIFVADLVNRRIGHLLHPGTCNHKASAPAASEAPPLPNELAFFFVLLSSRADAFVGSHGARTVERRRCLQSRRGAICTTVASPPRRTCRAAQAARRVRQFSVIEQSHARPDRRVNNDSHRDRKTGVPKRLSPRRNTVTNCI